MSWTAVNQQLRGLLPLFSLPPGHPASHELVKTMHDLDGEGGKIQRLQASGLKPSPDEAAALRT